MPRAETHRSRKALLHEVAAGEVGGETGPAAVQRPQQPPLLLAGRRAGHEGFQDPGPARVPPHALRVVRRQRRHAVGELLTRLLQTTDISVESHVRALDRTPRNCLSDRNLQLLFWCKPTSDVERLYWL